jgi:hypothetical protein
MVMFLKFGQSKSAQIHSTHWTNNPVRRLKSLQRNGLQPALSVFCLFFSLSFGKTGPGRFCRGFRGRGLHCTLIILPQTMRTGLRVNPTSSFQAWHAGMTHQVVIGPIARGGVLRQMGDIGAMPHASRIGGEDRQPRGSPLRNHAPVSGSVEIRRGLLRGQMRSGPMIVAQISFENNPKVGFAEHDGSCFILRFGQDRIY